MLGDHNDQDPLLLSLSLFQAVGDNLWTAGYRVSVFGACNNFGWATHPFNPIVLHPKVSDTQHVYAHEEPREEVCRGTSCRGDAIKESQDYTPGLRLHISRNGIVLALQALPSHLDLSLPLKNECRYR